MSECRHVLKLLSVLIVVVVPRPAPPASAAQEGASKKEIVVAGIMFDHDRKNQWMSIKTDGENEPVKYLIDPADEHLAKALQTVFNASRVRLAYTTEGDSRRLVRIQRQVLKTSGTVTGVVVKVHNNFWIELKPRRGVADAFAPGANFNDKGFMAKLKSLQPGDTVTIQYTTDFERHRIQTLRKHAVPAQPEPKKSGQVPPAMQRNPDRTRR